MPKFSERWIRYALAIVAFGLVAAAWHFGGQQSGRISPVAERKPMPDLVMPQLDGGTWRMTDHRGQVVLINYWAMWCGPCREEMPGLVRLSQELAPKGLSVVGIDIDENDKEKIKKFVDEFHITYPVTLSKPTSQMEFGMEGLPTTILVDKHGRVAKTYSGAIRQADFSKDINVLLGEQ